MIVTNNQNNRGVITIVGFLLVIGIIISVLSIYFTVILPENNVMDERNSQVELFNSVNSFTSVIIEEGEDIYTFDTTVDYRSMISTYDMRQSVDTYETEVKIHSIDEQESLLYEQDEFNEDVKYTTEGFTFIPSSIYGAEIPNVGYEHNIAYYGIDDNYYTDQQFIIQDDTITINLLTIDSLQSPSTNVDKTVSTSTSEYNTTDITQEDNPLKLTFETKLPEENWDSLLQDEKNVVDYQYNNTGDDEFNKITVSLQQGKTYTVKVNNTIMYDN